MGSEAKVMLRKWTLPLVPIVESLPSKDRLVLHSSNR